MNHPARTLLLLGLLALGCAASTPPPAAVTAEPHAATAQPTKDEGPRDFQAVSDRGLVTVQHMSLVGLRSPSTMRVATDGAWSWTTSAGTKTGKLDATQLAAVRMLLSEAEVATPNAAYGLPCEAITTDAARVLFGKDREMGWSGPCAGPPPPTVFVVLQRYLQQVADGRPASEIEKTLQIRRDR